MASARSLAVLVEMQLQRRQRDELAAFSLE